MTGTSCHCGRLSLDVLPFGLLPAVPRPSIPIPILGMLAGMPGPSSNVGARRQLQTQPHTAQNITRSRVDGAFMYVHRVWIHLTGLTGNEGVKQDFCTNRVLPRFSEMPLA